MKALYQFQSSFQQKKLPSQCCLNDNVCDKKELTKFGAIYQKFRENVQNFASVTSWPVLTNDWESKSTNFTWQKLSVEILKEEYFLGAFQYVKDNNGTQTVTFFSNVLFAPMIDYSEIPSPLQSLPTIQNLKGKFSPKYQYGYLHFHKPKIDVYIHVFHTFGSQQ